MLFLCYVFFSSSFLFSSRVGVISLLKSCVTDSFDSLKKKCCKHLKQIDVTNSIFSIISEETVYYH